MSKYLDMFIENGHVEGYRGGMIYPCFGAPGQVYNPVSGLFFKGDEWNMYFDFSMKCFVNVDEISDGVKSYSGFVNRGNSIYLKERLSHPIINDFRTIFLFGGKAFCLFYDFETDKSYVFSLFQEPQVRECLLEDINVSCVYQPQYTVG